MKVWRGELARALAAAGEEDWDAAARATGFERQRARIQQHEGGRAEGGGSSEEGVTDDPTAPPPTGTLQVPYWRVEQVVALGPQGESPPSAEGGLSDRDRQDPCRSLFRTPRCPPIASWSSVEPRLRAALMARHRGRSPDVDALVRALGRGTIVPRIPRKQRRIWPADLTVWSDRSRHLRTVFEDQADVVVRLQRLCGERLNVELVRPDRLPVPPRGGALLVLGDLGACANPRVRARWRTLGLALRRSEGHAVALCPVAPSRIPPELKAVWQIVPWVSRRRGPLSSETRETHAERLLQLASMARLVQPGLLRALRELIPDADVGTELDALKRPEVLAYSSLGIKLDAAKVETLKERFAQEEPELQRKVSALIAAWHEGLPAELLHMETLRWRARIPEARADTPGDHEAAYRFVRRLDCTLAQGSDTQAELAWRDFARNTLQDYPAEGYQQGELGKLLQRVWARANRDRDRVKVPEGVELPALLEVAEQDGPIQRWQLRQVGAELHLELAAARSDPAVEALRPGSPAGALEARERLLTPTGEWVKLTPGTTVPLTAGQPLRIFSDRVAVEAGPWRPGATDTAAGRDRYGLWVKRAGQRLRWMPPGRFRMGSPESEAGCDTDEGPQHEVELTQGFWLGETPVTQGLWMSLMDENPSRFQTDDRPAEQVSWLDAVLFCNRLSEHAGVEPVYYRDAGFRQVYAGGEADVFWKVGAAGFRLPTEAEWEYACRAGSTAATWRGDLEILGERNAPLLDEIAWYGGNSGKDFDLKEGHDSSGWPEKQYPHTKAGTRPVRLKQPNPWGLHDMLGNVLEWCYDHAEFPPGKYQADRQQDPVNMAGSSRVIRGGSWDYHAGYVRAAYRVAYPPGVRYDYLGFRLASGPAQGAEPQAPGGRDTDKPGGRE